jgi:quercetin dioxygenase-like cupin family protein
LHREARVNQPLLDSRDLVTRMSCDEPDQVTPLHLHPDDDEGVFCVEGRGAVTSRSGKPCRSRPAAW